MHTAILLSSYHFITCSVINIPVRQSSHPAKLQTIQFPSNSNTFHTQNHTCELPPVITPPKDPNIPLFTQKKTSKDSARQDNTLPFENDHKVIEQNQPLTIIKSGRIIKPKQYSDTLYYWHQAFNSIFLIHTFNFNFSLILTNTLFTCFTDLGQKKNL